MYKKITHEIVEEHYDDPAIVTDQISQLGTSENMPRPSSTRLGAAMTSIIPLDGAAVGTLSPLPSLVINERTMIFRMDSRSLWTRYSLGMINYSVSAFGDLSSTPAVERNLNRNAADVGTFFVPYYGLTAGTKIGNLLTVILKNGVKVVETVKNSQPDIEVYKNVWSRQIDELADYLNQLNPGQYPRDLLAEMFTKLTNFWVEDFLARFTSDFAADSVALDNILRVAVTGIPNHVNKGYSSIADILSRGVIAQFPFSFVE